MHSAFERARKYILVAREFLKRVEKEVGERQDAGIRYQLLEKLLDAAKRYLEDSEYYLNKGDHITALSTASYAEGLLDSLRYLGLVSEKLWEDSAKEKHSEIENKVLVGGTFDLLHPGHLALLKYAASKGKLYVIIARDSTVEKIKHRKPILPEQARLAIIESLKYVYKAVLGDTSDFLKPVEEIKPDIIVLGPDQDFDEEELKAKVEKRLGKEVVVERFPSRIRDIRPSSTTDIIKDILNRYCIRAE